MSDTHQSARPCGCDPGASYTCEQHRVSDCLTCDGYVLNPADAPYCPTCTRERARDMAIKRAAEFYGPDNAIDPWEDLDLCIDPECPRCARIRPKSEPCATGSAAEPADQEKPASASQGRSTAYLVRLKDKRSGQSFEAAFNSMTERVLYIETVRVWADVEQEWLA